MARIRCRIGSYQQGKLLELFIAGATARTAADLTGVHRHSATLFYHKIRNMIALELEDETPFCGEVEVDESYFGGVRKGTRGRGAAGKVPVFGILKRHGKVFTKVIADASSATLMPIIERRVVPDSIVYSDSWTAYNALDVSGFHHLRVNHSETYVDGTNRASHINGIQPSPRGFGGHSREFLEPSKTYITQI
jgi:transposase